MKFPISPHGGHLINRVLEGPNRIKRQNGVTSLQRITLTDRQKSDLDMIACGALSPLEGFMGEKDYLSVINEMRLEKGLPWTIPITLAATKEEAGRYALDKPIALMDEEGTPLAVLLLEEKFLARRELEAEKVYKTTDVSHPGVAAIKREGEVCLAGKVEIMNRVTYKDFVDYRKDPSDLRKIFEEKKWRRIVGFQTRNPIHRAHEYLTKSALEICDGLLIHPIVGETKSDDVPAEIRMKCYRILVENYYPKDRVVLSVNPAAMRYAGPREAVFHAIVRKNYGCTHFIVGRDHAGVGNYYGTFDAHSIFDAFDPIEMGITPLFFDHAFYCKKCEEMASNKTCPHGEGDRVILSGTKVREILLRGELPPEEFSRPEVARILIESMKKSAGQGSKL